jgi:hypothetical protein
MVDIFKQLIIDLLNNYMVGFFFDKRNFFFYLLWVIGIATFRDRYILTIDSKSIDNPSAENCRLLLFDPNNGQLVFEQNIIINQRSENILKQQYINHIPGRVLPESTSKPRFIAVHNDDIYIADLGKKYSIYLIEILCLFFFF